MDEETVLRNHALFLTSWSRWSCDHVKHSSRDNEAAHSAPTGTGSVGRKRDGEKRPQQKPSRSAGEGPSPQPTRTTGRPRASQGQVRGRTNKSAMTMVHVSMDPLTSRRPKRNARSQPWLSSTKSRPTSRSDGYEVFYESYLPETKRVEYRARQYVTNRRYGQLYEVRREAPKPKPKETPVNWLWEDNFKLWTFDMANPSKKKAGRRQAGAVSEIDAGLYVNSRAPTPSPRPHADLFAAYHNEKLANQRRDLAATVIERHVRGWLVRKRIKDMKRQALLSLGRSWSKVTRDYRELVTRIQARHGVMKTGCQFSLSEMKDYLEKRENYERSFEKVAIGDKLSRDQLMDFLNECGHFPTEGELTSAFNAVFRGSGSTAEVVFVLDCSTSLGLINFHDQMTFVKDVVRTLHVGPDRVRVGVVPFNTDVFQVFGLLQYSTQADVLQAIDDIKFRPGLTHTDVALTVMKDVFKDARPGVQKIAVVITDGQSANTERTALEAKKAADSNITVFAVGVGNNVEKTELENIARDPNRVFMCSSYRALSELKNLLGSKLCLRACTLCQFILPRVQLHGLYRAEVMEILYTLFVPPATGLAPSPITLPSPSGTHSHSTATLASHTASSEGDSATSAINPAMASITSVGRVSSRKSPATEEKYASGGRKSDSGVTADLNVACVEKTPVNATAEDAASSDQKSESEMKSSFSSFDASKEASVNTSPVSSPNHEKQDPKTGSSSSVSSGSIMEPTVGSPVSKYGERAAPGVSAAVSESGTKEGITLPHSTPLPQYENIIKATDFKVCLGLVVKSRLEREGVISIPSDVRAGVEEVTTYDEAMQKIEEYLAKRKKK